MDLDPTVEVEEHRLQTFNRRTLILCSMSVPASTSIGLGPGTGIGPTSRTPTNSMASTDVACTAASDGRGSSKSRKRAPRWPDLKSRTTSRS